MNTLDSGQQSGREGGTAVIGQRAARIVTTAPSYAVAGGSYRYLPKSNGQAQTLELASAPAGMAVGRGGSIEWEPTQQQAGSHRIVMRASVAGEQVEQEFKVTVASSTLRAEGEVTAQAGGRVISTNPSAGSLLGAGALLSARAVQSNTRVTVSELDEAPSQPNAAGRVHAVRFGPEGQVFDAPARVVLPLPDGVVSATSRLNAYVYQPAGRWVRVPVESIDLENRLMTARAQHFSVYAAVQSSLELASALTTMKSDSACEGALVGRATLESPLAFIELESINNLTDALRARVASQTPTVLDLLQAPGFQGSLRMVQVFELVESHDGVELVREQQLAITTLFASGDGSLAITHTDALGNVIATKHYPMPAFELVDLEQRLRGAATGVRFATAAAPGIALAARVHLAYFAGDASLEPVSADDLGVATVEAAPAAYDDAVPVGDGDCDGLLEPFDASDDRLVARLDVAPRALVNALSGEPVTLRAQVVGVQAPGAGSWSLLDPASGTLGAGELPEARVFSAAAAGRHLVSYRAEVAGQRLEHVFAIDVAARPALNTAPSCRPAKSLDIGRVGETVALSAITHDAESDESALRVEWGIYDTTSEQLVPASTLIAAGARALFVPTTAGNYVLGCRAFDGELRGPVGRVELSMAASGQNRAPDAALSPLEAKLAVGQQLTLHAWGRDPDGDLLRFAWEVDGADILATADSGNESRLQLAASAPGVVTVTVKVSDAATTVRVEARVLVGQVPTTTVDGDGDGWPAGVGALADCNDGDPKVHPTAVDGCGDAIDGDCDGSIDVDDCDFDGFTTAQGDCDDLDPRRRPQVVELCDGLDNDCDVTVDEAFSVGKPCVVGTGACTAGGVYECSADGLRVLCATSPLLPTEELCDGLDNDCDGLVDEQSVCASTGGQDASVDAGVSADAAAQPPDANPPYDAGVPPPSDGGSPDADGGSGCQVRVEVCNGLDDDCDGFVDNILSASCQTGLPGVCGTGYEQCSGGKLSCATKTTGSTETCNRLDDDCDGVADENMICMCDPSSTELCTDGVDNNCDGNIDGSDPMCGATRQGDSCLDAYPLAVGEVRTGTLAGALDDFGSTCALGQVDRVYRFSIANDTALSIAVSGPMQPTWAIYQGTCDSKQQALAQLFCGGSSNVLLKGGTYFLAIEGAGGAYDMGLFLK